LAAKAGPADSIPMTVAMIQPLDRSIVVFFPSGVFCHFKAILHKLLAALGFCKKLEPNLA